jgi:hypothetical protein
LQTYCCETQGLNIKVSNAKSDLINANVPECSEQKQTVVHRKINFDQVQTAIMTLVKEITADLRRRSWRKRLSEETLKRSLSSEMIHKLSPTAERTSSEVLSLFDNAIIYEEQDPSAKLQPASSDEEEEDEAFVSTEPYSMEILHTHVDHLKSESYQTVINSLRHSTRTSHSMSSINLTSGTQPISNPTESKTRVSDQVIALSNLQSPNSRVKAYLPRSISTINASTCDSACVERSLSCPGDMEHREVADVPKGAPYNMPGVLTVWRSYRKPPPLQFFRKYTLGSFEEMSPLTETGKFFEAQDEVTERNASGDKHLDQNLLGADRMKCTLAWMIAKAAEKIQEERKPEEAMELFKFSLGLFQDIPSSHLNANVIGNILKLIGVIKCDQGDVEGGIHLMEEAMVLLGADVEDSLDVADVLYHMGNAYMDEQWKDASLFDHVMGLVKNDIDNDIQSELGLTLDGGDVADDVSESDCTDSGESYTVCTVEAMGCYKQALAILGRLRQQSDQ